MNPSQAAGAAAISRFASQAAQEGAVAALQTAGKHFADAATSPFVVITATSPIRPAAVVAEIATEKTLTALTGNPVVGKVGGFVSGVVVSFVLTWFIQSNIVVNNITHNITHNITNNITVTRFVKMDLPYGPHPCPGDSYKQIEHVPVNNTFVIAFEQLKDRVNQFEHKAYDPPVMVPVNNTFVIAFEQLKDRVNQVEHKAYDPNFMHVMSEANNEEQLKALESRMDEKIARIAENCPQMVCKDAQNSDDTQENTDKENNTENNNNNSGWLSSLLSWIAGLLQTVSSYAWVVFMIVLPVVLWMWKLADKFVRKMMQYQLISTILQIVLVVQVVFIMSPDLSSFFSVSFEFKVAVVPNAYLNIIHLIENFSSEKNKWRSYMQFWMQTKPEPTTTPKQPLSEPMLEPTTTPEEPLSEPMLEPTTTPEEPLSEQTTTPEQKPTSAQTRKSRTSVQKKGTSDLARARERLENLQLPPLRGSRPLSS